MALQTYAGFTASTNTMTGVEFSKLYNPLHLKRVTQMMMFDKYALASGGRLTSKIDFFTI